VENKLNIRLEKASKRFIGEWIFREVSMEIAPREKIVVLGSNGSGKSTLMQIIAGYQTLTKGELTYAEDGKNFSADKLTLRLSISAPYLELIEDYDLAEAIAHQQIFKPFLPGLDVKRIIELSGLEKSRSKQIRLYSSGMKQRLKLTLAILADCPLLFLDEPCSNLDAEAVSWYKNLTSAYAGEKTILVCSNNMKEEFEFCTREIEMAELKEKISAK
jgi:ABC-2 type transport system ATP-binding protein